MKNNTFYRSLFAVLTAAHMALSLPFPPQMMSVCLLCQDLLLEPTLFKTYF